MLKVDPTTGIPYRTDIDYYCVYKYGNKYFCVKESAEKPYTGEWQEFMAAFEEEWNAMNCVKILNNNSKKPFRSTWSTKVKRK